MEGDCSTFSLDLALLSQDHPVSLEQRGDKHTEQLFMGGGQCHNATCHRLVKCYKTET